ncbi:unnamed protein product, partial [Rotaria sp. Silwood2]
NNNLFQIDSQTGIIRSMVEFDRKQQDTYVLHVQAKDRGKDYFAHSLLLITTRVVNRLI